jgi:hypothetical protein
MISLYRTVLYTSTASPAQEEGGGLRLIHSNEYAFVFQNTSQGFPCQIKNKFKTLYASISIIAYRSNKKWIAFALIPLMSGIQQIIEGIVWIQLNNGNLLGAHFYPYS